MIYIGENTQLRLNWKWDVLEPVAWGERGVWVEDIRSRIIVDGKVSVAGMTLKTDAAIDSVTIIAEEANERINY